MQKKLDENTNHSVSLLLRDSTHEYSSHRKITSTISSSYGAPPSLPPQTALKAPLSKPSNSKSADVQQDANACQWIAFRPLENYLAACFSSVECFELSFLSTKPHRPFRVVSELTVLGKCMTPGPEVRLTQETSAPDLEAKALFLSDLAGTGTCWTGRSLSEQPQTHGNAARTAEKDSEVKNNFKSPCINWEELDEWYHMFICLGRSWREFLSEKEKAMLVTASSKDIGHIEDYFVEACSRLQQTLLSLTENLLRRPGRPLKTPEDCRFLFILLRNPLLYIHNPDDAKQSAVAKSGVAADQSQNTSTTQPLNASSRQPSVSDLQRLSTWRGNTNKYSDIIKRILGLTSNVPSDCHHHFISWFSRFSEMHFQKIVELVGSFVTYRLTKHNGRKQSSSHDPHRCLKPRVSGPSPGSEAQLHSALGVPSTTKSSDRNVFGVPYCEDWQIKAAARVMSLLFFANDQHSSQRHENTNSSSPAATRSRTGSAAYNQAHHHRQGLPINSFYNTLLDRLDLIADFDVWESRSGKFSFCQYPMFLSIWAKIRILEHDARRQMETKARKAFFDSIMSRKAINQYLVLKVRRDCLVEDSLRSVSEVVGTGQGEIKKGLRIEFIGEEGLDSGGLRKEWFLLLVREVFDPENGLFTYDDDSHYCYFNPGTFETSDQFYLVGALLGLAIYNSTMLDVALPPFAFRKLLASAPSYTGLATSASRPSSGYTLEDLAEFRPVLAKGLRQLLEFDGDVKETFCRDFIVIVERYGQREEVPLCANGGNRAVTNTNRHEFVELYVKYLLDTSVTRQYEPFKRGFFTVCGGNALSLFRPEEIELLVKGSDEPLDVATLRAVAIYDGWGKSNSEPDEAVVDWFWDTFEKASPKDQRKLLRFITSSDRIPAMGAINLVLKITCLGDHCCRFPIARTCFNMLGLYRYCERIVLENKLWRAVTESEGFGMK